MSGARPPALSIVVVSWNTGAELVDCVASLAQARTVAVAAGCAVELIVIDNASADFDRGAVTRVWSDATVEVNATNRGFGPAANQGVGLAHGRFVLLLNPDTRADGDPFTPLVTRFTNSDDVVAFAPRLLDTGSGAESQERFQLRRLPAVGQTLRELLLFDQAFPRNPFLRRARYGDRDRAASFDVEQPAAAALAIRREVFLRIGGFDERFVPAWFEDVDLCARLRREGRIVFLPESRFVHAGGVAARTLGYDRFLPVYYRNARRYWRKHHGVLAAAAIRAFVAVGMVLRLCLLPFRRRVPRSRREAARAYLRVLAEAVGLRSGKAF